MTPNTVLPAFPSLYSITGDIKDINTMLVPLAALALRPGGEPSQEAEDALANLAEEAAGNGNSEEWIERQLNAIRLDLRPVGGADKPTECPVCHGTKRMEASAMVTHQLGTDRMHFTEECEHCCGTGTVWGEEGKPAEPKPYRESDDGYGD